MSLEMNSCYEFTFNKNTFDYNAGNAAFYDFRGASNIYDTMDNDLLVGDSGKILRQMIAQENYDDSFVLHIANHEKKVFCVVCRLIKQKSEELVGLRMIEMNKMFDDYAALQLAARETDALLAQYDCIYFSYDKPNDEIICYNYDMGKSVLGTNSLSEWQDKVKQRIAEKCVPALETFAANLRSGARSVSCTVEGLDGKVTQFSGTAVYNVDCHIRTVGKMSDPNMTHTHELTRRDQLTGLFLKETITNYAKHRIDDLKQKTILAIIDIDDFKNVNDNFGHAKGDEVLKKCAAIIEAQCGEAGKAGRIGGDEFFVVFDNGLDFEGIKNVLRGIKNCVYAAYTDEIDGFHVSTSIGLSVYPDDIDGDFDTMFQLADCLLYRAKRKGKNRWIVYNPEKQGPVEEILRNGIQKVGLSGMRGIDKSELVCKITNMMICGINYPVGSILYDIMNCFSIERVMLYNLSDRVLVTQLGEQLLSCDQKDSTIDYLYNENYRNTFENGELLCNSVRYFEQKIPEVYEELTRQGIYSLMQFAMKGESGKEYIVSFEAVKDKTTWNTADTDYLRILTKVMEHLL